MEIVRQLSNWEIGGNCEATGNREIVRTWGGEEREVEQREQGGGGEGAEIKVAHG